ncbi:uncharacterized protein JCM15063_002514 [Sporobolomyces koalae]|uniref:uncharacterized protein n=1 Tax=Sporobolomyces koalae TaxID=500713 RepID=UPI0031829A31
MNDDAPSSSSTIPVPIGIATEGGRQDSLAVTTSVSSSYKDARGKGKGRTRDSAAYGFSPIQELPFECLAHIFAHLPPRELGTCQLVCKVWNDVVGDETSWRSAFETYYGVTPNSLGRRIESSSWRAEYIARVALMRLWHRSRTPTVIHNPSLGALTSIHIQLPVTNSNPLQTPSSRPSTPSHSSRRDLNSPLDLPVLSISLGLGAAVHSVPFTGKLSKRPLLSCPLDNVGRPMLPMIAVSSCAVAPLEGGNRLVWGMRDGSLRISNSASNSTGRGSVGSSIEQGEVRQVLEAHREGTAVHQVAFSNVAGTGEGRIVLGIHQRNDVFVSVGRDGYVHAWSSNVPPVPGARERAPAAVKIWSARWDVKITQLAPTAQAANVAGGASAAEVMRHRVRPTAIAFDSGWIGRQRGRPASLAIGRSDGKIVVWSAIELPESSTGSYTAEVEPVVIETGEVGAVKKLVFDIPGSDSRRTLLVHSEDSTTFSRISISEGTTEPAYSRTIFGYPLPNHLSTITSIAVDFEEPPPIPHVSQPATPSETPSISLVPPRLISIASSSTLPSLSRANSLSRIDSNNALEDGRGNNTFGRRKYVVAGDSEGRVYLWDWTIDPPERPDDIVPPSKVIQDVEIPEAGGRTSKVTALELTEAGVFVGGLDGTLRFYSTLGPATTTQIPVRTFRDRSAPRHPSRLLAQGLVAEDDEERWLVSHIRANRDSVVAAIGGRILAWRTEPIFKKKSGLGFGKTGKLTARQERFKANMDLQHQVRESLSALSAESSARVERYEEDHRVNSQFGLPPSLDNLTEEEAIAFAMILSAEEEERKLIAVALDNGKARGSDAEESDGDWEQPPDEWLADDGVMLDEDYEEVGRPSGSRLAFQRRPSNIVINDYEDSFDQSRSSGKNSPSTSLTVSSSQYVRGSSILHSSNQPHSGSPSPSPRSFSAYNWKPASAASSPSLSALGSPTGTSNAKLQISPRLGPTYGSSFSNYANDPIPDMDPSLWPTAASLSTSPPPNVTSRKPSFASSSPASTSPFIGSRTGSPLPASETGPATGVVTTPVRRGWSQVAATNLSSASSPSPSTLRSSSPWHQTGKSLLSDQLQTNTSSTTRASIEAEDERRRKREEEDLRFAIELSMVEEASKLEI